MRRFIIIALLFMIMALSPAQPGRAQSSNQLTGLEINLYPEYDQPDMLVIYKITIPEISLTTKLTFRIPKSAEGGKPYEVASKLDDGSLYKTNYDLSTERDWIDVIFTPDSTEFQIEYYDTRLERFGNSHNYVYTWPGDYVVNSATIVILLPPDANHWQFTPANVTSVKGDNGLLYYVHPIGALSKSQTYTFTISYQKSTNTLTNEKLQAAGSLPKSMWNRSLPWVLGVLALVLIAGGVWVYWRSGLPQAGQRNRKRRRATSPAVSENAEDTGVYCHSCGRRASAGDVFCRSCGTQLRI